MRLKFWNTNPTPARRRMVSSSSEQRPISSPMNQYAPEVGESMSPSMLSRVDLPQPGGPIPARNSPGRISRDKSSSSAVSTASARYTLETCSSFNIDSPSVCQEYTVGLFHGRVVRSDDLLANCETAEDLELLDSTAANLDAPPFSRSASRRDDKNPIAPGALQEGADRKYARRTVVAQLQTSLGRFSRDQVGRTRANKIEVNLEPVVVALGVAALT